MTDDAISSAEEAEFTDSLPKRPRNVAPSDAHLDELLSYEEPPSSPQPSTRSSWILRSAAYSVVWSAVAYTALHLVELDPPYPMILTLSVGVELVRRAASTSREPRWQRTRDAVRSSGMNQFGSMGSGAEGGDGMLDAIQRWDDRLSAAAQVRPGSTATMANQIGVLADEVLRQHHGLTRSADPVRARALVGENLWTVWDDLGRRPRTPAELAAVVGRLETLRMEGQHGERT